MSAFNLRVKFHDWLWTGAAAGKHVRSWLGPRLPDYLADPYMDWFKDWKKHPEKWTEVEVTGPVRLRDKITVPSGCLVMPGPGTQTFAVGTTCESRTIWMPHHHPATPTEGDTA